MKLTISVLVILSPAFCLAQMAGNWVGAITTSQGDRRIVLHISGPDTALKATSDSPDQQQYNVRVDSITFSDSTLKYRIPPYNIEYAGVLGSDGQIAGTMTQNGASRTLILARSDNARRVMPPSSNLASSVDNGRYRHEATGVEFDLPSGWSFVRTGFNAGNNGAVTILKDSSGKALFIQVWMLKVNTKPENMPRALDGAVAHEVLVHTGEGPGAAKRVLPNYTIDSSSVQKTSIGGHPALIATGQYQRDGKNFGELLGWIFSENTRTHFVVQSTADDLSALRVTASRAERTATILDRLAAELAEAAALLRKAVPGGDGAARPR